MAGSNVFYGLIAVGAVIALASRLPAPEQAPAVMRATPAAQTTSAPALSSGTGIALDRAADGHFYAEAQVNGAQVRFLVDTGASGIVLTRADAMRTGIGAGDFSATGMSAGGAIRLQPVTLTRLAFGPVAADNVPAMVAEDGLTVSLLGQSFLSRWSQVTIAGDRLTLR